jgi:hypothetical protein
VQKIKEIITHKRKADNCLHNESCNHTPLRDELSHLLPFGSKKEKRKESNDQSINVDGVLNDKKSTTTTAAAAAAAVIMVR